MTNKRPIDKLRLTIIILLLIVIIASLIGYLSQDKDDATPASTTTESTASQTTTPADDDSSTTTDDDSAQGQSADADDDSSHQQPATLSPGLYVDYSQATFDQYADYTRLVYFHASWCPACRALEADIKNSTIPDNVIILKVDYDNSSALQSEYGVRQQTTVVKVDENGDLVDRFQALASPRFQSVIDNLL